MSALHYESVTGIHLVNLKGPLNISRAEDVVQLFESLSEQGVERIVVNLEDVPFIDSRGLVALIVGYKIFGGDAQNLRLAAVQNQPRLAFELTGFDHVFQIFDNVTEAIATGPYVQALPGWSSSILAPQPAALDWTV
jgi:anti-anti-sigma factor